jgi:hypothetical protein
MENAFVTPVLRDLKLSFYYWFTISLHKTVKSHSTLRVHLLVEVSFHRFRCNTFWHSLCGNDFLFRGVLLDDLFFEGTIFVGFGRRDSLFFLTEVFFVAGRSFSSLGRSFRRGDDFSSLERSFFVAGRSFLH